MKVKKIISAMLVLLFATLLFTACQDKEIKEISIGEYTDASIGVTYSIYKLESETEDIVYAKVSRVEKNSRAPEVLSITIPSSITYNETDYEVTTIGDLAFYQSNYDIINISAGITTIEKFAFSQAKSTRIDLPASVKTIGDYAFLNCMGLRDIYLYAILPPNLGKNPFSVVDKSNKYVNSGILNIRVPTTALKRYKDINEYPEWELYQGNIR